MDFDTHYQQRLATLNEQQHLAVTTIDGPVMVVAGPGTGKTELLSMRAATILRETDTLPENILCLTFTDSGSLAMQKRLSEIIGADAYNVSVFTFHAFGSEIINRHREYFYRGAEFRPADELRQRQIITDILDGLAYNDPLATTMNGEYTNLKAILTAMSELKKAGLTAAELQALLQANQASYHRINQLIADVINERISRHTLTKLEALLPELEAIDEPTIVADIEPYSVVFLRSLRRTIAEAHDNPKVTPPLTTWKNSWTHTNAHKQRVLKASKHIDKLLSLCTVYQQYLEKMEQAQLYDYDDMILQVVQAMETQPELRYELQEKYHYIMVDEFQDTNMAQMRILHNLTNNPVVEGLPNILVVGDDDQAIYSFQGADVGNILHFKDKYRQVQLIPLTHNYRSVKDILAPAQAVMAQGTNRLKATIPELAQPLVAQATFPDSQVQLVDLPRVDDERYWLVQDIKQQLANGVPAQEIAVIATKRRGLTPLVPYFAEAGIAISYDKRDNVLDDAVIEQLGLLATVVVGLQTAQIATVNERLPQLLSHPAWQLDPAWLWRLSLEAYTSRRMWLDIMTTMPETQQLATWLQTAAKYAPHTPLERMLDYLIGNQAFPELPNYSSPLKDYFFAADTWHHQPDTYLSLLHNLITLRGRLREHLPDLNQPRLTDFLDFITALKAANTTITSTRHIGEDSHAVRLMTAHSSKGLEFDSVYIVNATDTDWVKKQASSSVVYPENLLLRAHEHHYDDVLRLFFVAMTRAKRRLIISYSHENDSAKETLVARFLSGIDQLQTVSPTIHHTATSDQTAAEKTWYAPLLTIPKQAQRDYLASTLANYHISATAINSFVDITKNGPDHFLLHNLLHFPATRSIHAEFGEAIHQTLQHAHDHLQAHQQQLSETELLDYFANDLTQRSLTSDEQATLLAKGRAALTSFLAEKYATFNPQQRAELQFRHQNVIIDDVRLTGKIDVVEIDSHAKSIIVTDYKTGRPLHAWDRGADHQKIKAHKYRQQLLFYKLLVEHSRDWHDYHLSQAILQFVEPDPATGQIGDLTLTEFDPAELDRFRRLVQAIWQHIQQLDFPDTSQYPADLKGILAFEDDLIAGNI